MLPLARWRTLYVLVLGRSGNIFLDREISEELTNLPFTHVVRMSLPMKQDERGASSRHRLARYESSSVSRAKASARDQAIWATTR